MGIKLPKIDWSKLNPLKSNPVTAVADATGKVADAAQGIVIAGSKGAQATKRHSSDMLSDSRLSKAIRPIVLIWAMSLFTVAGILSLFSIMMSPSFQQTINLILGLAVGFYFPGRTFEKLMKKK